jgi:anaerobic magnesium-protoporphyrin IX monomethyl ester cyclase
MKICLINPPMDFEKSLGRAKSISKYTAMAPMGLAYIASYLLSKGVDVDIIDAYAENLTIDEIVSRVGDTKIVGITCVTPTYPTVNRIANRLKEKVVVVGGPHPTVCEIDEGMVRIKGEGERPLCELLGIDYTEEQPFPAYQKLPLKLYKAPPHWAIKEPVFYMFLTRGCPFHCTFCAAENMGKKRKVRKLDDIMAEISTLVYEYGAKQIMFQDTCFPLEKKFAHEFCDEMIRSGFNKKIVWTTSTRVDVVDFPLLEKMYKSGCRIINYGLESGNQAVLDRANKGVSTKQAEIALKLTRRAKIMSFASFILGLPGDTLETCLQTISWAKKLPISYAQFYLCVPYPGSQIYNEWSSKSIDWQNYTTMGTFTDNVVYVPEGMTSEQLKSLQKKAYKEFYFRPKIILQQLTHIRNLRDILRYVDVGKALWKLL